MKILQILFPGLGGHSSVALSLIEGDVEVKNEHILLGYGIEGISPTLKSSLKSSNIQINSIKKKVGFDFKSLKKVLENLKKINPDSIICHSTAVVPIVWWYCLIYNKKFISVEHQSNLAKSKKDWIYTLIICFLSPKIVYLTDNYKSEIKKKLGILFPKNKIYVIPNGINTKKFYPLNKDDSDSIIISMISRMNNLRDHNTLIKAVNALNQSHNLHLIIAGDGSTKSYYENLVEKNNLKKITFVGNLNEKEVISLIHKTDIYVHSSLAETLSTSLLQVMACKVPIIATNIPGINNLIINGKEGLLFEKGDIKKLIFNIEYLINNNELVSKLTNNAYKKILKHYSCAIMFRNYEKLLNEK